MTVVIADSSCLILFTNIGRIDLLQQVFREVWITSEVQAEYNLKLPAFVSIHDPVGPSRSDPFLQNLDAGEASSIALALENPGCTLIIDEKKGRRVGSL